MSKPDPNVTEMDWTPENEIKLFYAMRGHKPVGVAKNFHMICILDEFVKLTDKEITSKTIWNRLETMYDMETLHDNEDMPFPNITSPFNIEDNPEFSELFAKRNTNNGKTSEKDLDVKEEMEVTINSTKSGPKGKTQDSTKSNSKVKTENEKNSSKCERKEESTKQSDKSDDNTEDKTPRVKKQVSKQTTELRSSTHSTPSSAAKKRK
ncbi:unnamed protein product [Oppiella nova]|uniref:MRG-binding protein n=1 Tax=Oppiella nova TaxID=334625 RepID=A0A7R9L9K2_9ACAR|nr:unnamed protein product [Oppiella nova]CAG2160952.1 unnamed protein product [Oppiella nova]